VTEAASYLGALSQVPESRVEAALGRQDAGVVGEFVGKSTGADLARLTSGILHRLP